MYSWSEKVKTRQHFLFLDSRLCDGGLNRSRARHPTHLSCLSSQIRLLSHAPSTGMCLQLCVFTAVVHSLAYSLCIHVWDARKHKYWHVFMPIYIYIYRCKNSSKQLTLTVLCLKISPFSGPFQLFLISQLSKNHANYGRLNIVNIFIIDGICSVGNIAVTFYETKMGEEQSIDLQLPCIAYNWSELGFAI